MPKKVSLPPVDQAKILIGELDIRDLESVLQYTKYMLSDKQRAEKAKKPAQGELHA